MRKVFTNDLQKKGKSINWKNSMGQRVNFIYDNIKGEVELIKIDSINSMLTIKYNDIYFEINTSSFKKCCLGEMLGLHTKQYLYEIDEVLNSTIKITKRIKIKNKKAYEYECVKCGNVDKILEGGLKKGNTCNVCSNNKVLEGFNDINTVAPWITVYMKNKTDAKKHNVQSNKKLIFKCPDCGDEREMIIANVYKQGFRCNKCSDSISYSQKLMHHLLTQLDIDFETEYSPEWIGRKRYDFYIPLTNCIVEMHGLQHYEEQGRGKSLIEEQENDKIKERLAKENGIENYIIIDCKKSELEWIKNNIMKSKLLQLLNFKEKDIDWLLCEEFAISNLCKTVCGLWNSGIKDTTEIKKILKLCLSTINKYLKKGTELGWCDYDTKKIMYENGVLTGKKNSKKVICLNNNRIYDSTMLIEKECGINHSSIVNCCNKKVKTAGKDKFTKERLKWMYYEDYIKNINQVIGGKI